MNSCTFFLIQRDQETLPQRRLLFRPDLQGNGIPNRHVPCPLYDTEGGWMGCPLDVIPEGQVKQHLQTTTEL